MHKISGDMAGVSCPCCDEEMIIEEYMIGDMPSNENLELVHYSETGAYCEDCTYILMPDEYKEALMETFG